MELGANASSNKVVLIPGDGIGPEVASATMKILDAAGARVRWVYAEAGEVAFARGLPSGVPKETLDAIEENRVVLKGPLATPIGTGQKSANVTLRKLFETFANVRPVREMPGVTTPFSGRGVDLVVVRENVEDLYAGIEHMQTPNVAQCLKLISRTGCDKIVRLAFDLAVAEGRKSIHCATKANIMKMTEGMLQRTFENLAKDYRDVAAHHILVDNCAHQLVRRPEQFEVIVTSNMNGDILSDLTSGLIGGLGFAPSANLGSEVAIFEPVHGSAPDIAGRGLANPTAMILSAVMMLRHIGQGEVARVVEGGTMRALASGAYTSDVRAEGALSTDAFAEAVIRSLGQPAPDEPEPRVVRPLRISSLRATLPPTGERRTVGADIFVESVTTPDELGAALEDVGTEIGFTLTMISNRGTKVFPSVGARTECVDHWRCRFKLRSPAAEAAADEAIAALLSRVSARRRWMHVEKLFEIDGVPAFSKAQGED